VVLRNKIEDDPSKSFVSVDVDDGADAFAQDVRLVDAEAESMLLYGIEKESFVSGKLVPGRENESFGILKAPQDYDPSSGLRAKMDQSMHNIGHAPWCLKALNGCKDHFVTQALFVGSSRRKSFFRSVRLCWVDLDIYRVGLFDEAESVARIVEHTRSIGLPDPGMIVSSGRGFYCKWFFDAAIFDLVSWEKVQGIFVFAFSSFGRGP